MKTIVVLYTPNGKIYKVFSTWTNLAVWCTENNVPPNSGYQLMLTKGFKRWWILLFHKIIK